MDQIGGVGLIFRSPELMGKPHSLTAEGRAFYYIDKITQMSPIDGPILLVSEICFPHSHTSFDNIPKNQPSKAKGLGGVAKRILTILIYSI